MSTEQDCQDRLAEAERLIADASGVAKSPLVEELRRAATEVRGRAYAPYSEFAVGAALLGDDGVVYVGCNVENASYGATLCAERGAVAQMVAAGTRRVAVCLVIASGPTAVPPCGPCRQVLSEFETRFVVSVGPDGEFRSWKMDDLFPDPVRREHLG